MFPLFCFLSGLVVFPAMVDLPYQSSSTFRLETSTYSDSSSQDLSAVHIVHGEDCTPLIFVHDESEAFRLSGGLVSR
jgi:hypothetical protein